MNSFAYINATVSLIPFLLQCFSTLLIHKNISADLSLFPKHYIQQKGLSQKKKSNIEN